MEISGSFKKAAETRIRAIASTPEVRRQALAQHLTQPEVASFAASLFSDAEGTLRCLDLGGGTGILSIALANRYGPQIERMDTVELDPVLVSIYNEEVRPLAAGATLSGDALTEDACEGMLYDRIILNPPYKKMAASDPRQKRLPVHSTNLYSAFVACGIQQLADGGELVAIIPRSWTNGEYFFPFRRYMLSLCSLDAIHVYGSRDEVFCDTDVLQETMLVRLTRGRQVPVVRVSESDGKGDVPVVVEYRFTELVDPDNLVVRVRP